jgi:hypothetical protein
LPNVRFDAWFRDGNISAYDWPLGTQLTLEVEDPATPNSPDVSMTTEVGVAPWNPSETLGEFHLNGAFTIEPGMTLTVSGASFTKELLVSNLTITGVDPAADFITGGSELNQPMWMYFDNAVGDCCREFTADGNGIWSVDYSQPGSNGEPAQDIGPGSSGTVNARDDDGDNTSLSWRVPNPTFGVRANTDQVEGWEWTLGSTITVTVDDPGTTEDPDVTQTAVV